MTQQLNGVARDNVQYADSAKAASDEIRALQEQLAELDADSADLPSLRVRASSLEDKLARHRAEQDRVHMQHEAEKRQGQAQVRVGGG